MPKPTKQQEKLNLPQQEQQSSQQPQPYSSGKLAANRKADGSSNLLAQIKSSPIPSPEDLLGYKDVDSEFPKKIIEWADLNQKVIRRRILMEYWFPLIRNVFNNLCGLAVAYLLIECAKEFLYRGATKEAAAVICVPLVSGMAVFVTQKYYQQKSQGNQPPSE